MKNPARYFIFLCTLVILSFIVPNKGYATEKDISLNTGLDNQLILTEDKTTEYIEHLQSYIIVNEDMTLSLDKSYVELNIPLSFIEKIENNLTYLNNLISNQQATVNPDLSISLEKPSYLSQDTTTFSTTTKGCGRSGHDVYWWGYNIFLNCNETRTTYQSFKAGGGATIGISAISRFIPIPPTQLASAIAGAIGGGLVGFGEMIQDEHEGHGVRIRFTGLGYAAIPTGVFPQ